MTQNSELKDCGFICYYFLFVFSLLGWYYVMFSADDPKLNTIH